MRNKQMIEYLERKVERYGEEIESLKRNFNMLEKSSYVFKRNVESIFQEYVVNGNNLVCPVCGGKVHLVIDTKYKVVDGVCLLVENSGTTVYKIKCNNHCVGVRDESIFGAVEKFKSLKLECDSE